MKQLTNRKLYDTDKADRIAQYYPITDPREFNFIKEKPTRPKMASISSLRKAVLARSGLKSMVPTIQTRKRSGGAYNE